jgi:hypothetical protein
VSHRDTGGRLPADGAGKRRQSGPRRSRKLVGHLRNWPEAQPPVNFPTSEAGNRRRKHRASCSAGVPSRYLVGRNKETGDVSVFGLDCRQRTCRRCGPKRSSRIRKTLDKMTMACAGRTLFLTLTLPQDDPSAIHAAWLGFAGRFKRFWKRLKRSLPACMREVTYAWVLEPHKSGWPHLHMLVFGIRFIHWRKVLACWKAVGGGHVDVQRVKGDASSYITKYVSKQQWADEDLADWLSDNRVRWYNATHREAKEEKTPNALAMRWIIVRPDELMDELSAVEESVKMYFHAYFLIDHDPE